jgi:hypothetical protein
MWKYLLVLVLGLAAGYEFGFNDAKAHSKTIVSRMIDRVGGASRNNVKNDIDKQMETLEKR